jgi:hypothetical protein
LWQPVSYCSEELQARVDALIDEIVIEYQESGTDQDGSNLGVLIAGYARIQTLILSAAKLPSYADEKESRIAVINPPSSAIMFGAGKAGPRPRVALTTIAPSPGGPTENDDALPIREIRLGPASPRGAEHHFAGYLLPMVTHLTDFPDTVATSDVRPPEPGELLPAAQPDHSTRERKIYEDSASGLENERAELAQAPLR